MARGRILKSVRISEVACVDSPAHEGARMVIMKAKGEEGLAKQAALTTATDGHSHSINCSSYDGERCVGDTSGANTSSGQYHSHPWVMGDGGDISVGENLGHTHEVAMMSKLAARAGESKVDYMTRFMGDKKMAAEYPDAKQRAAVANKMYGSAAKSAGAQPEAGTLADAAGDNDSASSKGDDAMSDQKAQPSAEDRAKAAEVKVTELEKKLARQESISKLSDAERAFSKSMAEPELDAFLAKAPAVRAGELAKAAEADPVAYTGLDGTEYRKSANPQLLALAKRADQFEKAQALAEAKVRDQEYAKRAETTLSHLPGAVDSGTDPRVDLLKAVDSITDEGRRARAVELLKAADAAMAPAFRSIGKAGGKLLVGSAEDKLDAMAKQHAKDHKVDFAKAYRAVLDTDEGKALYDQVNVKAVS